jgi:uncharacterized protein (DUF1778 family)
MVRLDAGSKKLLAKAAALRHISMSDYVRTVTVSQAQKEVRVAEERFITMTPQEQLAFWKALNEVPRLTESQRRLGKLMRGGA